MSGSRVVETNERVWPTSDSVIRYDREQSPVSAEHCCDRCSSDASSRAVDRSSQTRCFQVPYRPSPRLEQCDQMLRTAIEVHCAHDGLAWSREAKGADWPSPIGAGFEHVNARRGTARADRDQPPVGAEGRSEEHTSELQSLRH